MMCSWQIDQINADVVRLASRLPSSASQLFDCPRATPSPDQRRIVETCVRRAQDAGLTIPARVRLWWVQGRHDIAAGAIRQHDDGSLTMVLAVNVDDWSLARTTYHELRHAGDFAAGRPVDRQDYEARAVQFAATMLAQW